MSILIKGMEMPVFEHQSWDIRKGADGKWYVVDTNAETSDGAWHEIVPIPPHGRKCCMNCKHESLSADIEPCVSCIGIFTLPHFEAEEE